MKPDAEDPDKQPNDDHEKDASTTSDDHEDQGDAEQAESQASDEVDQPGEAESQASDEVDEPDEAESQASDEADGDKDADDATVGSDEAPEPKAKRKPKRSRKKGRRKRSPKAARAKAAPSSEVRRPKKGDERGSRQGAYRAPLFAAVALIIGAVVGWLLRDARAHAAPALDPDSAAVAASAGPCKAWQKAVCKGAGVQSAACGQAKAAAELLPDSACNSALGEVPATLKKVKASHAVCDKLVNKLCQDLGAESPACKMVKQKGGMLPPKRCQDMLGSYDKVLEGLRHMGQRGGRPGHGGLGHGPPGRPGAGSHVGPPGGPGAGPHGGPHGGPGPAPIPAPPGAPPPPPAHTPPPAGP